MKAAIKKYYLGLYYIFTILISGLLLLLHTVFKTAEAYSVTFPQLAPALAVILLSIILKDNTQLSGIKSSFKFHAAELKWILLMALLSFAIVFPSSLFVTLLGVPYVPWSGDFPFYLLSIAAILIGCITEEVGWRGFLLPKLQKKHSPLVSSVIIGILWGIWHFRFADGALGYFIFIITCIEMSVIMTWIFNKTNNLTLMVLWHFLINIFSRTFLQGRMGLLLYVIESILFGIVFLIVFITQRKTFLAKPDQSKCA